jgi:hypothetical protein
MTATELVTNMDLQSCKQRLLSAARPGYFAVGTDGTNELTAWAPSSPGEPPSGVSCKIALSSEGAGTRIAVSTCSSSLARTGFMCWSFFAGWAALRFGLFREGAELFDRLLPPLGFVFSISVMVLARVTDGRSVKERVVNAIRLELNVQAAAADPRGADRAVADR